MILHSIVDPKYIFPYEISETDNSFSTNPFDYLDGTINCANQYMKYNIYSWREIDGNRKKR